MGNVQAWGFWISAKLYLRQVICTRSGHSNPLLMCAVSFCCCFESTEVHYTQHEYNYLIYFFYFFKNLSLKLLSWKQRTLGRIAGAQVLGVKKDADVSQIRKGYHKKALKAHPDKAKEGEKEKANEIFGALSGAWVPLVVVLFFFPILILLVRQSVAPPPSVDARF